jgi:2-haloacid dehalogenase
MAGFIPAIHDFVTREESKTWMAGSSPAMTRVHHLAIVTSSKSRQSYKPIKGNSPFFMGAGMFVNRREFVTLAAAAIAAPNALAATRPFKAIAFDGFPIIDSRPVFAKVEELFAEKGRVLNEAWRTRLFEYTWLRTLGGHYEDFWRVAEQSLIFAAKTSHVDLVADQRDAVMQTWLTLKAWPDVTPALKQLKAAGVRMAFLSNLTASMMDAVVKNAGLEGFFEPHLSTDRVKAFKPAPIAYQMGLDAFKLPKEEIAFAAFAGWDVAGAKWFGYPTFWVNRAKMPLEELDAMPDGAGPGMSDLVKFVLG